MNKLVYINIVLLFCFASASVIGMEDEEIDYESFINKILDNQQVDAESLDYFLKSFDENVEKRPEAEAPADKPKPLRETPELNRPLVAPVPLLPPLVPGPSAQKLPIVNDLPAQAPIPFQEQRLIDEKIIFLDLYVNFPLTQAANDAVRRTKEFFSELEPYAKEHWRPADVKNLYRLYAITTMVFIREKLWSYRGRWEFKFPISLKTQRFLGEIERKVDLKERDINRLINDNKGEFHIVLKRHSRKIQKAYDILKTILTPNAQIDEIMQNVLVTYRRFDTAEFSEAFREMSKSLLLDMLLATQVDEVLLRGSKKPPKGTVHARKLAERRAVRERRVANLALPARDEDEEDEEDEEQEDNDEKKRDKNAKNEDLIGNQGFYQNNAPPFPRGENPYFNAEPQILQPGFRAALPPVLKPDLFDIAPIYKAQPAPAPQQDFRRQFFPNNVMQRAPQGFDGPQPPPAYPYNGLPGLPRYMRMHPHAPNAIAYIGVPQAPRPQAQTPLDLPPLVHQFDEGLHQAPNGEPPLHQVNNYINYVQNLQQQPQAQNLGEMQRNEVKADFRKAETNPKKRKYRAMADQDDIRPGNPMDAARARDLPNSVPSRVKRFKTEEGIDYWQNTRRCFFYGSGAYQNLWIAGEAERKKMTEIEDALYEVRDSVGRDKFNVNFRIAKSVLDLTRVFITENTQICVDLFAKFVNGSYYTSYTYFPKLVVHPESDDCQMENRAKVLFDTLVLAFDLALKENLLEDFFTHAFFEVGENTVCLESSHKALIGWMETVFDRHKRQASVGKEPAKQADNTTIANEIGRQKSYFEMHAQVTALNQMTLRAFKEQKEKTLVGKELMAVLEKAEEDFAQEFRHMIIQNTLTKLREQNYNVSDEDIESVIEMLSLL